MPTGPERSLGWGWTRCGEAWPYRESGLRRTSSAWSSPTLARRQRCSRAVKSRVLHSRTVRSSAHDARYLPLLLKSRQETEPLWPYGESAVRAGRRRGGPLAGQEAPGPAGHRHRGTDGTLRAATSSRWAKLCCCGLSLRARAGSFAFLCSPGLPAASPFALGPAGSGGSGRVGSGRVSSALCVASLQISGAGVSPQQPVVGQAGHRCVKNR